MFHEFQDYLLKSMNLSAFIYAILLRIMKRYKLNCKLESVKKIDIQVN